MEESMLTLYLLTGLLVLIVAFIVVPIAYVRNKEETSARESTASPKTNAAHLLRNKIWAVPLGPRIKELPALAGEGGAAENATVGESNRLGVAPEELGRHILVRGMEGVEVPGPQEAESPVIVSEPIETNYLISYPSQVYINRVVPLRVDLANKAGIGKKVDELKKSIKKPAIVPGTNALKFTHNYMQPEAGQPLPKPQIQVELKFAEGDFEAPSTKLIQGYDEAAISEYLFSIKPLKSEELPLAVEFSYVEAAWSPRRITGIEETRDASGKPISTKTTYAPSGVSQLVVPLATEHLTIGAKSFLGMNEKTLDVVGKALAVAVTLVYILIATSKGLTEDPLGSWVAGITAILGIVGIPVSADLWGKLAIKKKEDGGEASE
jgi:hypothetical protein